VENSRGKWWKAVENGGKRSTSAHMNALVRQTGE